MGKVDLPQVLPWLRRWRVVALLVHLALAYRLELERTQTGRMGAATDFDLHNGVDFALVSQRRQAPHEARDQREAAAAMVTHSERRT